MKKPQSGDAIIVPPSDEFMGGRTHISSVFLSMSRGKMVPFVTVSESSRVQFNWESLAERQKELTKLYGDQENKLDTR